MTAGTDGGVRGYEGYVGPSGGWEVRSRGCKT